MKVLWAVNRYRGGVTDVYDDVVVTGAAAWSFDCGFPMADQLDRGESFAATVFVRGTRSNRRGYVCMLYPDLMMCCA